MTVFVHCVYNTVLYPLYSFITAIDTINNLLFCYRDLLLATLRIWSLSTNKAVCTVPLYWKARCVGWDASGSLLAVGFHESVKGGVAAKNKGSGSSGSSAGKKKNSKKKGQSDAVASDAVGEGTAETDATVHNGAVHIYSFHHASGSNSSSSNNSNKNPYKLVKRSDGCTSSAWIGEIKFSPDSSFLAVGSHDKHAYIYRYFDCVFIDCLLFPLPTGVLIVEQAARDGGCK